MASNYLIVGIALVAIVFLTWLRFRLYQKAHAQRSKTASKCPYTRTLEMLGLQKRQALASSVLDLPIDARDATAQPILADLQCNIFTGHGRYNARFLFIKIDAEKADQAKSWLAAFARNHVTSALKQTHQRTLWREAGLDGGAIAHVAL